MPFLSRLFIVYHQPRLGGGISYSPYFHQTFHKSLIKNWSPTRGDISYSQSFHQTFHKSLIKNCWPRPEGSFYSIFCEKIVHEECSAYQILIICLHLYFTTSYSAVEICTIVWFAKHVYFLETQNSPWVSATIKNGAPLSGKSVDLADIPRIIAI